MCIRDSRLPEYIPLDTTQHVDEAVALFDTAVVSAVDVSSRMKPGLTPDYQRIPEEVSQLACERNRLRRRWQRTRDPAEKAAFNRASGKSVSYTHLDVYKRQVVCSLHDYCNLPPYY